jgi:hypothetical protein
MKSDADAPELDLEGRKAILKQEIDKYVARGYRVVKQLDTNAELFEPKVPDSPKGDTEGIYIFSGPDWMTHPPYWPRFGEQLQEEGIFLAVDIHGHIGRRRIRKK